MEKDNTNCAQRTLHEAEKRCHSAMRKSREQYYMDLLAVDNHDQVHLFKSADSLLHRNKTRKLPAHGSPALLASRFAEYIHDKIELLRTGHRGRNRQATQEVSI